MRLPDGRPQALVVGVYPSAFHIAWSPPAAHDPRESGARRRPYIGSLAVDVEPTVFWNGKDPDPSELLQRWKAAVHFDDHDWGTATLGANGPSGNGLVDEHLRPLGLDASEVAFTDAVPWYFAKRGLGSQGDARDRLRAVAVALGVEVGELPERPTVAGLVEIATGSARRDTLRAEILGAGAPLVITLGNEALRAVAKIADHVAGAPSALSPDDDYGKRAMLEIDGTELAWIPLAHPGLLRQQKMSSAWALGHAAWKRRAGSQ